MFNSHSSFSIVFLKELRNYNHKLFFSPPWKKAEIQLTFETFIFQNKFTLWHIRLNIYIWKIKFTFYKQYLLGHLFSRNAKKYHNSSFLTLSEKETYQKPSKVAPTKKYFPSVYTTDTTCFDECFSFHLITGRYYFYTNLSLLRGLVQPPCCCVLSNKSSERSPYFKLIISTITLKCC